MNIIMNHPSPVRSAASVLHSPARRKIVELLSARGDDCGPPRPLTAGEMADRLDLHVTTVRFHLDHLEAAGVLTSELLRGRVGRPRKTFSLVGTPEPAEPAAATFAALAEVLANAWPSAGDENHLDAEEAGRRWALDRLGARGPVPEAARTLGAWLGKVGLLVDLLVAWGYDARVQVGDKVGHADIAIVDCPFLELARTRPDVVCGVHRGLLRGAMEAAGETDVAVSLRPFVTPRSCTALITPRKEST